MVKLNNFIINNQMPFTAILGPCQIESKAHAEECNAAIKEICDELDINYIFKSSFDKANRSSILGKRGIGMYKGLNIMSDIRESGTPTLTDVHETDQVKDPHYARVEIDELNYLIKSINAVFLLIK